MGLSDELKLARSFDNSDLAYCIIRVILDENKEPCDWEFIYLNNALAKIEGIPKENLINNRFFKIFPNADKKWLTYYYSSAYENKSLTFEEISEEINSALRIRCFPVAYGYCGCIIEDISELVVTSNNLKRTIAEKSEQILLTRQMEYLTMILASGMYSGIYRVDLKEWSVSEIIVEKRNIFTNYNGTFDDFIKSQYNNVSEEFKYIFGQFLNRKHIEEMKFGEKSSVSYHGFIKGNKDSVRSLTTTIYRYKIENNSYALIVTNDHTDAVKLEIENEKKLKEVQTALQNALSEAKRANQAKSSFLRSVSHDIRTPMNAIIGFTSLALQNLDDPQKLKDYLTKISLSGNHLLMLINDILDLTKIENGKITLDEKELCLTDNLSNIRRITESYAKAKSISILFDYSKIKHSFVFADKLKLDQIILNLIDNAIKFTHNGGIINITASEFQDKSDTEKSVFEFRIKDNGIGMSDEFAEHIFEEFSQENYVSKNSKNGTGLGMSIVKKLVDLMNGTISVKSQKGYGSEFTVSIPLKVVESTNDIQPKAESEMSESLSCNAEKRILLVEDNSLNQEIAVSILTNAGFAADAVDNGFDAISIIENPNNVFYDLILMDIQMPEINGYDTTRKIRKINSSYAQTIPILALSADVFESDKLLAAESGMNGFIAKPIDISDLKNQIDNVLNNRL